MHLDVHLFIHDINQQKKRTCGSLMETDNFCDLYKKRFCVCCLTRSF